MSRPIVVTACMFGSSESWGPQQHPHPWHFRAGGGAVHSIKSSHCWALDGSPGLLDLCHCELAVDTISIESDLIADFHLLEHGRILRAEDHRHPFNHVELFDRAV